MKVHKILWFFASLPTIFFLYFILFPSWWEWSANFLFWLREKWVPFPGFINSSNYSVCRFPDCIHRLLSMKLSVWFLTDSVYFKTESLKPWMYIHIKWNTTGIYSTAFKVRMVVFTIKSSKLSKAFMDAGLWHVHNNTSYYYHRSLSLLLKLHIILSYLSTLHPNYVFNQHTFILFTKWLEYFLFPYPYNFMCYYFACVL